MNASELRIGNWVNIIYPSRKVKFRLELPDLARITNYPQQYGPIPLTEEWLDKFGFEYIENETYCNGKQWTFQLRGERENSGEINRDGTWFDGIGDHSWMPGSDKPKTMVVNTLVRGNYACNTVEYVHQLQNLHHALTGKEL